VSSTPGGSNEPLDLGEFEAFIRPTGCSVAKLDLTPEQRAKLEAAIARHDITAPAIVKVLATWDRVGSETSVLRHRRRVCRCFRD
jgi:hypothetical protein